MKHGMQYTSKYTANSKTTLFSMCKQVCKLTSCASFKIRPMSFDTKLDDLMNCIFAAVFASHPTFNNHCLVFFAMPAAKTTTFFITPGLIFLAFNCFSHEAIFWH